MRQFLAILISSLAVLLINPTLVSAAALTLSPADGILYKGCSYQIQVNVNTQAIPTQGVDAVIEFEASKLGTASEDITKGAIYPDAQNFSVVDNKITISGLATVDKPFNGQGKLATILFRVPGNIESGPTTLTFAFDPSDLNKTTDSNIVEAGSGIDLLTEVTNGSYSIADGTCQGTTPSKINNATAKAQGAPTDDASTLPDSAITTPTILLGAGAAILIILGVLGFWLL